MLQNFYAIYNQKFIGDFGEHHMKGYLFKKFFQFDLIFSSFIPRFINNIYKCKSVSASGAEQVKPESFFAMYGLYDPYIYYVFMYD